MMTMVMPSLGKRLQHGNDLGGLCRSQSCQGFVEQENARLSRQRAGQFHQPKLFRRQATGNTVGDIEKADAGNGVGGKAPGVDVIPGMHVSADHDIIGDRQPWKRPHDLEGAADAGIRKADAA